MALIPCAECRREISDRASACPTCGCPITTRNSSPSVQVTHVRHQEVNRGFSKGIDKGMEQLGTGFIKFVLTFIGIIAVMAAIGVWAYFRCPECDGFGKTWGGLMTCSQCEGTGWRK